jgi:uncharacterized short protein YbdD (DUF466 family)
MREANKTGHKIIRPGDLALFWRRVRETVHLMVGLPDYGNYVTHVRTRHPGQPVMTKAEFVAERTSRRYEGKGAGRCC